MDLKEYKAAVEAILFAYAEPITVGRIADVLEIEPQVVDRLIRSIKEDLEEADRGICLFQTEDRWQLSTKNEYGEYIKKAMDTRRNVPLSQAAMEVLAIIAYNQPVSRSFIEQVRGVDSSSTVQNLISKGLIEEAGRLDLPGKPISFKTTDIFLRTFGMSSLSELPSIHQNLPDAEQTAEEPEAGADNDESISG